MDESKIRKIVKQWIDAWNSDDFERIGALYAEDVILYQAPVKKTSVGREHVIARAKSFIEMSSDAHLSIRELYISRDTAIMENNFTGTHTGRFLDYEPTGRSMDIDTCITLKFREDGKIIKHTTYLDTATVLRAVGLVSMPSMRQDVA